MAENKPPTYFIDKFKSWFDFYHDRFQTEPDNQRLWDHEVHEMIDDCLHYMKDTNTPIGLFTFRVCRLMHREVFGDTRPFDKPRPTGPMSPIEHGPVRDRLELRRNDFEKAKLAVKEIRRQVQASEPALQTQPGPVQTSAGHERPPVSQLSAAPIAASGAPVDQSSARPAVEQEYSPPEAGLWE